MINTFSNPNEWWQPWKERYDAILDQIEWIDRETDIDGVDVTEHHFYDDGYIPATMVMCAAIAARTRRLRIGTNLIQMPLHNPVRLAEDALTVDALSCGRLRLGLGMGYYHQEFEGLNAKLAERVSRTEEGVAILRNAFAGKPFEFHGKRYDFDQINVTPRPVRMGGPEIWMGGFAPGAVRRAARLADGFLEFDNGTHRTYFEECDRIGKAPSKQRLNVTYWAIIAEDPERAFAQAGHHWLHLLNQYIARDAYAGRSPALTRPYDDPKQALDDGLVMLADGPSAVKTFNADVDKGAVDINLLTMMPGEPVDQVTERLAYLNDKVIPNVKHTSRPAACSA